MTFRSKVSIALMGIFFAITAFISHAGEARNPENLIDGPVEFEEETIGVAEGIIPLFAYDGSVEVLDSARNVGYLQTRNKEAKEIPCSAISISSIHAISSKHCFGEITDVEASVLSLGYYKSGREGFGDSYVVDHSVSAVTDDRIDILIASSKEPFCPQHVPSQLSIRAPKVGEGIFIVHHPAQFPKMVSANAEVCRVAHVEQEYFYYLCPTVRGSSGAPVFSKSGELLGTHRGKRRKKIGEILTKWGAAVRLDRAIATDERIAGIVESISKYGKSLASSEDAEKLGANSYPNIKLLLDRFEFGLSIKEIQKRYADIGKKFEIIRPGKSLSSETQMMRLNGSCRMSPFAGTTSSEAVPNNVSILTFSVPIGKVDANANVTFEGNESIGIQTTTVITAKILNYASRRPVHTEYFAKECEEVSSHMMSYLSSTYRPLDQVHTEFRNLSIEENFIRAAFVTRGQKAIQIGIDPREQVYSDETAEVGCKVVMGAGETFPQFYHVQQGTAVKRHIQRQ